MREKVLQYIRQRALLRAGDRVAVAVSGGADSVALLRVLLELRAELGVVVSAAHFNHGLRGEQSDADEAFVADLAKHHGLEYFAAHGNVRDHAFTSKLSLEAAGRELRYRWFAALAEPQRLDAIATAHTLDDQAETVLLKFLRGAGSKGLAGIYPVLELTEMKAPPREVPEDVLLQRAFGESPISPPLYESATPARLDQKSGLAATQPHHESTTPAGVDQRSGLAANQPRRREIAANQPRRGETEVSPGREPWVRPELSSEPRRDGTKQSGICRVIRPLLHTSRQEVEDYLTAAGQSWREDESNLDRRFQRNRVRHELLPLLAREFNPNIRQVLSDLAEIARGEEEFWQGQVDRELESRLRKEAPEVGVDDSSAADPADQLNLDGFAQLPPALQRRALKGFAERHRLAFDFEHIERLRRCALGELSKTELPGGRIAERAGHALSLRAPYLSPEQAPYRYVLPVPGEVHIAELKLTLRVEPVPAEFAQELTPGELLSLDLVGAELTVRNWLPGDRFWPVHRGSTEKLKRLFAEKHIPAADRPAWPVVLRGQEIVWVRGFPVAHSCQWRGEGSAVRIQAIPG